MMSRFPSLHLKVLMLMVLFSMPIVSESSSSSSAGGTAVSPVRHLEASLAASSAHGTVVAVQSLQDEEECVVLVAYKPSDVTSTKIVTVDTDSKRQLFGLVVSEDDPSSSSSWRWKPLGDSGVCAMTGFAADIQHLKLVILRQVESYKTVYSHTMPIDRVVRALSSTVQRAARAQGGRPYGVQTLLVGLDKRGKMLMYTVDPAGGWRHFGGAGTAIGRDAENVKKELCKVLQDTSSSEESGARAALRAAIMAVLTEQSSTKDGRATHADKLDAALVWKSPSGSCRATKIHNSEIESCLQNLNDKK